VGGVIGAIALLVAVPITRPLVLAFGPPEFLMLTVLGLCFIGTLAGGSSTKGLLSGLLGLSLSLVGQDPNTGSIRYDFGMVYLWDGIKQIPALVGLFAVAEMIDLGIKGEGLVSPEMVEVKDSVWEGVKDVHRHWWLTLKSSLIAVYIGFLPGLGGSAAAFFTYGYAQRTSKHPETFGKGNVEGVIAPEAANNAKEGGALIPTIAFGVPGSTGMAILLGAFVVLGITPGPKMLNEHLPIVFAMAWTLAIANIVGALETLIFARPMARVTFVRGSLLISPILICAMLGSFSASNSMADLVVLFVFGVIGYFMKLYGYPKAPLVLAMILGRIAEVNFQISYTLFGPRFLLRPFTFLISLLVLWTLLSPLVKRLWKKRKEVMKA
jgi:putative tricarboxylic transport membrane protein